MNLFYLLVFVLSSIFQTIHSFEVKTEIEQSQAINVDEDSDEIYWKTEKYLSKLEETSQKVQYVYHRRAKNFTGTWILPLNLMPYMDGYNDIYKQAISKYTGREKLLSLVIPTLNCLWNDVVFLSPVHPHLHYEEYKKNGYASKQSSVEFFKIPIDVLRDKHVTIWKWLSEKKYPIGDPIHESLESYCDFDFDLYQERSELPKDTKDYFERLFDPENPEKYPPYNWYRIPHILCQDPIDILDERITIINWEDPIDNSL